MSPVDEHFTLLMRGPGLFCQKVLTTCVMSARTTHVQSLWLSEARVKVCTPRARLCPVQKNRGVLQSVLGSCFLFFSYI